MAKITGPFQSLHFLCKKNDDLIGVFYIINDNGKFVPVLEEDLECPQMMQKLTSKSLASAVNRMKEYADNVMKLKVRRCFPNQGVYREALWYFFKLNYFPNGNWLFAEDVIDDIQRKGRHIAVVESEIGAMYMACSNMKNGYQLIRKWERLFTRWSPLNSV
ncbi:hypothetical protein COT97_05740 [Candidatus Falkowbacteria bacterium CG10_big_fil_rev_8_21_14_0_10_39_11]|uniref:Uncharacterized protein n=1 Tax=Candidatus Falkowbacteria bacterium CG10_big_fil_rev_8_21_14_0_10_39_11 TaxID=1974565 RepID=A0A2H0V5B5_9BACT|nr:MAG: hypothetical protein COT97_05740 [Candidatus Falkowbacteria bacterium CG10_big_fil_rev_8_21_14_0_10_39_11]